MTIDLTSPVTPRSAPPAAEEGSDGTLGASPPSGTSSVETAALAIGRACEAAGVDEPLLRGMLRTEHIVGLDRALTYTFNPRSTTLPRSSEMAKLVAAVEKVLDLDTPIEVDLRTGGSRVLVLSRDIFAGAFLILCVWLVIGGILSGQNLMAQHTSPAVTLVVLLASLGCLALLEAAHIGAVALSTADVSELRESHPRVFKLHPDIATKDLLEDYLAGRQAGVVLVVFAVAEVTRTAGMATLPGTQIGLPGWMDFALQIGVPGAVMVLIIGQVAPQLITARRPAAMMNTAPMYVAFSATRLISKIGLANPAYWLVSWSKEHERIPSAPRERHDANTLDVTGHGVDSVLRRTRVGAAGTTSETVTSSRFHQTGLTTHTLDVGSTPQSPTSSSARASLQRGEVTHPVVVVQSDTVVSPSDGNYHFIDTLAPRMGTYEAGDLLRSIFEASFRNCLDEDTIVVSAPTRLVVMRVVLEHPSTPMPPATLTIVNEGNVDAADVTLVPPVMSDGDGSIEFVALVRYTSPGSVITLRWGSGGRS